MKPPVSRHELDIWNEGYGAGWHDRGKLAQQGQRPKRSRQTLTAALAIAWALGVVVGLLGCAPAPMLASSPCAAVVDTVTVTGAGGQRIGLERTRCVQEEP